MFCVNCGNELLDNNKFCASCGCGARPEKEIKPSGLQEKQIEIFSKPIIIFFLILWGVLSLGCLLWIWGDTYDISYVLSVLPIYVAIPLIIYFIIYIRKRIKGKEKVKTTVNQEYQNQSCEISYIPLIDFVEEYGNMQVCKLAKSDGSIYSKCVFTKITEVEFSNELGYLTAREISENKAKLFVTRNNSGNFILKSTILQK